MTELCPCLAIDCPADDPFLQYSLQAEIYPFVLNCPPGYNCQPNPGSEISLVCCDDYVVTRTLPNDLTQEVYTSIITSMIQECRNHEPFCGGNPNNYTLFWNAPQSCTVECPDGNPFTYTVSVGVVLAATLLQANQLAHQKACAAATAKRICLGSLSSMCCVNASFSATIRATGGGLATSPSTNNWSISSGSIPTGMTFHGGDILGSSVVLDGTPTVAGTYNFTVKVQSPDGNSQSKSYTLNVIGITPTTLPDVTIGVPYSQQLTAAGLPSGSTATWAVTSGTLPDGLFLSGVLGLISGTPTGINLPSTFNVGVTITP